MRQRKIQKLNFYSVLLALSAIFSSLFFFAVPHSLHNATSSACGDFLSNSLSFNEKTPDSNHKTPDCVNLASCTEETEDCNNCRYCNLTYLFSYEAVPLFTPVINLALLTILVASRQENNIAEQIYTGLFLRSPPTKLS